MIDTTKATVTAVGLMVATSFQMKAEDRYRTVPLMCPFNDKVKCQLVVRDFVTCFFPSGNLSNNAALKRKPTHFLYFSRCPFEADSRTETSTDSDRELVRHGTHYLYSCGRRQHVIIVPINANTRREFVPRGTK